MKTEDKVSIILTSGKEGRCLHCALTLPPNYKYKTCKKCRLMKSKKYYAKKESR